MILVDKVWQTEYKEPYTHTRIARKIESLIDEHCDILRDGCYNDTYLVQLVIRKVEDDGA